MFKSRQSRGSNLGACGWKTHTLPNGKVPDHKGLKEVRPQYP